MSKTIQYYDRCMKDGEVEFTPIDGPRPVSESTSLATIKAGCPNFFKFPFTERERHTMYRGFVICTGRQRYSDNTTRKVASAFYYDTEAEDTFDISAGGDCGSDTRKLRKLIDRVLDEGRYFYGMSYKGPEHDPDPNK